MKAKIWYRTEIATEFEQTVQIQPGANGDSIEIAFKESHEEGYHQKLILNEPVLEAIIAKMREMMEHIKHG